MGRRQWQEGFTLLEMLVALTVFALLSAMVYGGQVAVLNLKRGTEQQAEHLKRLQTAMLMLERDIGQHVLRPVRDDFGDNQPPMESADFGDFRLSLTRAGWENLLNQPRSTLQRVAYGLEDEKLIRYSWSMLDRAQGSEPDKVVLLEQVRSFKPRFLDQQHEWQEQWPARSADNAPLLAMPLAVELILELDDWGAFRRLIPTVGYDASTPQEATPEGQS
jgi:general secretion pathway protein J